MPRRDIRPMDQKKEFVREYRHGLFTMTEKAESYEISRKTGYAIVRRVDEFGVAGLRPQSRRPHTSLNRTPDHIAALLIEAKLQHPARGPYMLLHWLKPRHSRVRLWPSLSTAGAILKRADLVKPRSIWRTVTVPVSFDVGVDSLLNQIAWFRQVRIPIEAVIRSFLVECLTNQRMLELVSLKDTEAGQQDPVFLDVALQRFGPTCCG